MKRGRAATLATVGVAAALLHLAPLAPALRLAFKPVPVLALLAWLWPRRDGVVGRAVSAGLGASALGDVLLGLGHFLPGLLAFLAAHVAYVAGFVAEQRRPALARLVPFAAWSLAAYSALRPGLGAMALPVAAYIAVITAMMWRAAARVGSPALPRRAALVGLGGAVAFGASDTLLAFDRFAGPLPGAGLPIMLLYWLGQWGIAASVAPAARRGHDRPS